MIIEFSVKNYRSIRDLQTISFKATGLKSPAGSDIDADNIVKCNGVSLLKTVGLYGANASGKSNMLMALSYFAHAVRTLATDSRGVRPLYDPFLFETSNEGCFFQVVLLLNGKKYRYGFVVNKSDNVPGKNSSNDVKIESEWLYGNVGKNMKRLFLRVGNEVKENNLPTSEGMVIPTKLPYPHTLFLVHAAAFDAKGIPEQIVSYLKRRIIGNIVYKEMFRGVSINAIKESTPLFLSFLKLFNMKYDDIELIDDEIYANINYLGFPLNKVLLKRTTHDGNNKPLYMNLEHRESSGNKKIFDLAGVLFMAFYAKNDPFLIVIDEIDSNFHPSLLIKLIEMFNDPKINKNNSQLLFTSHDTNLMSPSIMRRDQFYFAEKQEDESTRLYSLADLRGIRNDADFAKQYLAGYYGALPVLNDYTEMEENENGKQ
ncbi:AAA family ATPase [Prevotella nigrescens]|uniref:AAA family ATPase n=1 Tax=Prevotella nigrescens TaxID=28133 RepID=UPI0028E2BDD8|nr:AAA family ATPase [Prevotella nigrescens]